MAGLYLFDTDAHTWARSMADLLIDANAQATAARTPSQTSLNDPTSPTSAAGTAAPRQGLH